MSYNGSGTFSINTAGQPVITGTVISSTAFNALTADLATGLSTAITKDGQTTTTSRILFAQGISSTLVTDATSATTGSIITAGGISTQKALWVGTTSQLVGAVSSSAGITNGTAGQISNSISQNSLTSFQVTNSNAGAAAQASYRLYNGNTIADLSVFGTAFTADGVRVANGVALDARPGGAATLALLGTTIRFAVNTTTAEVARFGTDGSFLVGTTSNGGWVGSAKAEIYQSSNAAYGLSAYNSGASGGGGAIIFRIDTTSPSLATFYWGGAGPGIVGSITTNGTTTAYNTSSDARLKTNVSDAAPASALIDAIQVRQFDWKSDDSHQRYGMVAQELLEVAPEAVSVPADPEKMMGVDYSKLVPMLIKEVQSLRTRLAALESK